jgi:hypothetical protein
LAGISKDEAHVELKVGDKSFRQLGPLLITHWGFSGPAVLKLSAYAAREFLSENYRGQLIVNWLPEMNFDSTFAALKDFQRTSPQKTLGASKVLDLPKRLWQRVLELQKAHDRPANQISDKTFRHLAEAVHRGTYDFDGKGEFKEEFVTCGGVDLKEINLKTFESKVSPGLYLAGEIIDVDGITGGFNFQNAWTSSRLAAHHISSQTIIL